jgi:Ca2+-binding RTX toxin-like protein
MIRRGEACLGNDTIYAGGDDLVYGGEGNDSLFGEAGNDKLLGDAHKDVLDGGKGKNELIGGQGTDSFIARTKDKVRREDRDHVKVID